MNKIIQMSKKIISLLLVLNLTISGLCMGSRQSFAVGDKLSSDERPLEDGIYEILSDTEAIGIDTDKVRCLAQSHGLNERFCFQFDEKQKTYTIRSMYTGEYLGAKKENGEITELLCKAPKSKEYYQEWIVSIANGSYVIELKTERERLAIQKRRTKGDRVFFTSDKKEIDYFFVKAVNLCNGVYEITSPALISGEKYSVFDTTSVNSEGQGLGIREQDGYANQKFYIERQYDAATKDTYYTIMCMYPRMLLGVDEKGNLICKNTADDPKRYRWDMEQSNDGYVKIKSKSTGKFLEVKENNICLSDSNKTNNQKFMFYSTDEFSSNQLISRGSDREQVIEVRKSEANSRIVIDQFTDDKILQQGFAVTYNYANGSYSITSFETGVLCSNFSGIAPLTLCDGSVLKSNACWTILKFHGSDGDYVSYVLLSSLESSEKKSEYLSINVSEGAGKELVLTNKPLDGSLGTQSFQIIDIDLDDGLMSLLEERFTQAQDDPRTPELFPTKEELYQVEESESLDSKELEKEGKISKSLSIEDLREKYPKEQYPEYEKYLDQLEQTVLNPEVRSTIKSDVMKSDDESVETIAKKLSYVYNTINSSSDVQHLEEYPVQMLAVMKLVQSALKKGGNIKGSIGEIKTGEGKSFIVMLSAILLQSYGRTVDIVAPNMALVKRDSKEQEKYYKLFGISSGYLYNKNADASFRDELNDTPGASEDRETVIEKDNEKRKCVVNREYNVEVFDNDIVYSTSGNFQWVYLYERMAGVSRVRDYDVCIVDEADDVLLDGSSNPAQLAESFPTYRSDDILETIFNKVKAAKEAKEKTNENLAKADMQKLEGELQSELQKKIKEEEAKDKLPWEEQGPGAKFDEKDMKLMVEAAKEALKLDKDKDYICKDGKVVLVDRNTGFILPNTKLHAYIHEMIEIKEKMEKSHPSVTTCAISPLTFFNGYANLIGVTGTAGEAEEEGLYKKWYRLETFRVPTNREIQRDVMINLLDEREDRYAQLEAEIKEYSENRKQPVLVILDSIEATNKLHDEKFPKANLIQGIDIDKDKVSIAQAGQAGTITLSTVAAGRGTDIKLTKEAIDAGGLHVIVANLPARSRTLMQNIGRCSRQGQPGSATVYVSPGDSFQEGYNFSPSTWNLFKIQEMFYNYIKATWPDLMRVDRKYYNMTRYRFGATVDDILDANERMIARRFFWPGKKNDKGELFMYINDEEYHMYLNMVYDMLLKAWGRFYTDLSMSPESDIWEKDGKGCKPKYDAFIAKIKAWAPKENGQELPISQWIKAFAQKTYEPYSKENFGQVVFDKLYMAFVNNTDITIEDFIYQLFADPLVQIHMRSVGINTWAKGITDEKFAFLPKKHQDAYKKLLAKRAEHEAKVAQYWRDMAAYESANVANAEELVKIRKEMEYFQNEMSKSIREAEATRDRQTQEAIDAFKQTESSCSLSVGSVCHAVGPSDSDASLEEQIKGFKQRIAQLEQDAKSYASQARTEEGLAVVSAIASAANPLFGVAAILQETAAYGKYKLSEQSAELAAATKKELALIEERWELLQQRVDRNVGECTTGMAALEGRIAEVKAQGKQIKKPEYPKEPKWSEIGREDFCDLSIGDLIWLLFGDPQRVVEEYRNAMLPKLEKEYGGHLPEEYINYLDNEILNSMRETAGEIQKSAYEVRDKKEQLKITSGVNKIVVGAEMAYLTYATAGTAPIFKALATTCDTAVVVEGADEVKSAITKERLDERGRNFVRDTVCGGNDTVFTIADMFLHLGACGNLTCMTGKTAAKLGPKGLRIYTREQLAAERAAGSAVEAADSAGGTIKGTAKTPNKIVGTEFKEILPTQDVINRERIDFYKAKLMSGEKISPIKVFDVEGKGSFIVEGHHRFVASQETGIPIEIIRTKASGPVGLSSWKYVEYKEYINEEQFWG